MRYLTLPVLVVLFLCAIPAQAEKGLAISAKAGTLGVGVELTKAITKRSRIRFGLNTLNIDIEATESNIDYDIDVRLRTASVIFDFHPTKGSFRISAGIFYNGNELDADATGNNITIGNTTYANASLNARVKFDRTAPYLGVGWGNTVKKGKRFTHSLDLGVLYQGKADVRLRASAGVSQADLTQEERELEDALDDYKYYPVITYGFSYRF